MGSQKNAFCLICEGKVVYLGTYKSRAYDYMLEYMVGVLPYGCQKHDFLNKPIFEVWTETYDEPVCCEYDIITMGKFYRMGVIDNLNKQDGQKPKDLGVKSNSGEMYAYNRGYNDAEESTEKDFKGYLFK